jgi:hypothetical protein
MGEGLLAKKTLNLLHDVRILDHFLGSYFLRKSTAYNEEIKRELNRILI